MRGRLAGAGPGLTDQELHDRMLAQVLSELRTLLTPLLAEPDENHGPDENQQPGAPAIPHPRPGGLAAMESMLAGAELLMVGCGEEEAW